MKKKPMGIVFLSESGQPYVYVTETNQIITIQKNWYDGQPKKTCRADVLNLLFEEGFVNGNIPERIVWPVPLEEYRKTAARHLKSLVLEITQQCTLRCDYCIYSGNYTGVRTHRNQHMSMRTMQKSIDYLARNSTGETSLNISFYGGEPLLRFDVIRAAVKYARKKLSEKSLAFYISSNGTTLREEVIGWLAENKDVGLTITLNGSGHDRYRHYPSGNGSLSTIMEAINRIKKHGLELWKRVDFIANIATYSQLLEIREFYRKYIGKPPLMITGILTDGGNDTIRRITQEKNVDHDREIVHKLYYETCDPYIGCYYKSNMEDLYNRAMIPLGRERICTLCCMPFTNNLFVAADGTIGICEKTNPCSKYGTIDTGVNIDAGEMLLKEAQGAFNRQCRKCWAQRLCSVCFQDLKKRGEGELYIPEEVCIEKRKTLEADLKLFCTMQELHPDWE